MKIIVGVILFLAACSACDSVTSPVMPDASVAVDAGVDGSADAGTDGASD